MFSLRFTSLHFIRLALIAAALAIPTVSGALTTPVRTSHLNEIQRQFSGNGLLEARVEIDADGRISLQGTYNDSQAVDIAFSIAQTVVGVRWVSPVTPENIKQKDWAKKMSSLFPTAKPSPRDTTSAAPNGNRPTTQKGPSGSAQKYAIVVGVGTFEDRSINPLQFAAKDATDFYNFLLSDQGGNFPKQNIHLLLDETATRINIEQALRGLQDKVTENDLVMVYFSSHGTPPNKNGSVQVVTYDTQVKPRHQVWPTSLSEDKLADFIQGIRAKRLVVVLDTCYSNGAYRKVANFLPVGGKSLGGDEDEGYGNSRKVLSKRLLGAKDLVLDDEPAPSRPGRTDGDGSGRVLISASDAGERSWESDRLKNGFFTYHFMSGIANGGDVKSAFEYAKPKVTSDVRSEKDQEQTPQVVYDQKNWAIKLR